MIDWLQHGWSYFVRGGLVMWPLLLCSLVSLTIILERWSFFRKEDSGRRYVQDFCQLVRQQHWQVLLQESRQAPGAQARLGVRLLTAPRVAREKESYVLGEGQQLVDQFEKGLDYLSAIVTLAPILGLLGTITGMMASFQALGDRWDNPLGVTAGVSEAMITTVFGLLIAIGTICFHTYFSQRADRVLGDVEQMSNAFMENARTMPWEEGDRP
ncbi:MotA/TolQ/ExbB proton channel family protein [Acidaminococcus fermentans]|uniref:MotA/TolQ/ExbB proton channel family protein n=1 Tax=Acidaminococcus fermentans TaxID=905 RepID=UPI0024301328|nr:MotA/TolQ/ExbB proton channel family protein [Acidaminococcus fermentans]